MKLEKNKRKKCRSFCYNNNNSRSMFYGFYDSVLCLLRIFKKKIDRVHCQRGASFVAAISCYLLLRIMNHVDF